MANALASPHIFEIAFDALTAAVGGLVILLALRVAPALTLSAHRLALRISIVAAVPLTPAPCASETPSWCSLSPQIGHQTYQFGVFRARFLVAISSTPTFSTRWLLPRIRVNKRKKKGREIPPALETTASALVLGDYIELAVELLHQALAVLSAPFVVPHLLYLSFAEGL
jgi:hypothetical protein